MYYKATERLAELYPLLQDEKSQRIFWSRIKCDIYPDIKNIADLYADAFDLSDDERLHHKMLGQRVEEIHAEGKKLLLYGTGGCGMNITGILERSNIPFDGYCGRRAKLIREIKGKPVYTPEYLFAHADEFYVIIAAEVAYDEILGILKENHFPDERILPYLGNGFKEKYFEFSSFYRPNTAFVDAGCFNGADSLYFSQWSNGQYSKIFAFEPDSKNYEICKTTIESNGIANVELLPYGLSDQCGTALFQQNSSATSHIYVSSEKNQDLTEDVEKRKGTLVELQLATLDSIVGDTVVGFIKMDIEGSEYDALHGAEKILKRDKPLCSICVYHIPGDLPSIMDYLHTIVPEYRFWLRHHTANAAETILYAAVEPENSK